MSISKNSQWQLSDRIEHLGHATIPNAATSLRGKGQSVMCCPRSKQKQEYNHTYNRVTVYFNNHVTYVYGLWIGPPPGHIRSNQESTNTKDKVDKMCNNEVDKKRESSKYMFTAVRCHLIERKGQSCSGHMMLNWKEPGI